MRCSTRSRWILVLAIVSAIRLSPLALAQPQREIPTQEQRKKAAEALQKKGEAVLAIIQGIRQSKRGEPTPGDDAHRALLRQRLTSVTNEVEIRPAWFPA